MVDGGAGSIVWITVEWWVDGGGGAKAAQIEVVVCNVDSPLCTQMMATPQPLRKLECHQTDGALGVQSIVDAWIHSRRPLFVRCVTLALALGLGLGLGRGRGVYATLSVTPGLACSRR